MNILFGSKCLALCVFAYLFLGNCAYAQQTPSNVPSVADFAKPLERSFSLSPDGKMVALLSGDSASSKVNVFTVDNYSEIPAPLGSAVKPRSVYFADNGLLLVDVSFYYDNDKGSKNSKEKYEIVRSIAWSLNDKTAVRIMPNADLEYNVSLGIEYYNKKTKKFIVSGMVDPINVPKDTRLPGDNRLIQNLYSVDFRTGKGDVFAYGNQNTIEFFLDHNAEARLRYDVNSISAEETLMVYNNKTWSKLLAWKNDDEMPFKISGLLNSEEALVIEIEGGVPKILNLVSGEIKSADFSNLKDVSRVLIDKTIQKPIAAEFKLIEKPVHWIDPFFANIQNELNNIFKNKEVTIQDWDEKKEILLIGVEGGDFYPRKYLFNVNTRQLSEISLIPPSMATYTFTPKEVFRFKASDGVEIPVFVTKPKEIKKKMPTIILPHGGPEASDTMGFDYISQFLASRGYIIIQPQFRGSTGFGADFADMGRGEWGGKMQSDVNEAFDWAVQQGWVDKDRACIVGLSYGGYSAIMGATQTPDKYKCASSFGGVFDLASFQNDEIIQAGEGVSSVGYWISHIGLNKSDKAKIREISPAYHADKVKIPVQLIHASQDTTVFPYHSRKMAKALEMAGKKVEFLEIKDEDHWLSTEAGRIKYLSALEQFLGNILKPNQ